LDGVLFSFGGLLGISHIDPRPSAFDVVVEFAVLDSSSNIVFVGLAALGFTALDFFGFGSESPSTFSFFARGLRGFPAFVSFGATSADAC
jgi:hypothetical protein